MRSSLFHETPRRRRVPLGLTMVEILVVIGVIAILMSLILPSLASIRRSSRAVTCASNMRQIGMAHQMYMNINRYAFANMGLTDSIVPNDLRNSWLMQLAPYLDGQAALRSPVDLSAYWSTEEGGSYEGKTLSQAIAYVQQNPGASIPDAEISRWSSYAISGLLTDAFNGYPVVHPNGQIQWRKFHRLQLVPRPETTVHFVMLTTGDGIGDPLHARRDHVHTDEWIQAPLPDAALQEAAKTTFMNAHGGRLGSWNAVSNYLYVDGRVETLSFNVVYENPESNRFLPIAAPSN